MCVQFVHVFLVEKNSITRVCVHCTNYFFLFIRSRIGEYINLLQFIYCFCLVDNTHELCTKFENSQRKMLKTKAKLFQLNVKKRGEKPKKAVNRLAFLTKGNSFSLSIYANALFFCFVHFSLSMVFSVRFF